MKLRLSLLALLIVGVIAGLAYLAYGPVDERSPAATGDAGASSVALRDYEAGAGAGVDTAPRSAPDVGSSSPTRTSKKNEPKRPGNETSTGRAPSNPRPAKPSQAPAPERADVGAAGFAAAADASSARGDPSNDEGPDLNRGKIREVMDQYRPVVKECYNEVLTDFPEAEGEIVLSFDIVTEQGEGRIELAELGDDTTLFDTRLHDCMFPKLGDLSFPAPSSGETVRVNYPFRFNSGDDSPSK